MPILTIYFLFMKGWIQFSYTSSHLWTLIYAIDVRRITFDQPFIARTYHIFAWGSAVVLCAVGLTMLYLPQNGYGILTKIDILYRFTPIPTCNVCHSSLQPRRLRSIFAKPCGYVFSSRNDMHGMSIFIYICFSSS